jgi:ABC-type lipoprotein release transport system permease subunit
MTVEIQVEPQDVATAPVVTTRELTPDTATAPVVTARKVTRCFGEGAAILPARRASKLNILEALQYE